MNYLAHAFLSFRDPDVLMGNMISDFVKGKQQYNFPASIQKGIRLHRYIDNFTDEHPATREARALLRPAVGKYAGAFVDVIYDHFLALDAQIQSEEEWMSFTQWVYLELAVHDTPLPDKFALILPHMTKHNWLFNYRYHWGIERSFEGLARRATYLHDSTAGFEVFLKEYGAFGQAYAHFFPDVKNAAHTFFHEH